MINRKEYLNYLVKLKDKKIVKIITGIRRCGKSTLLALFRDYLKKAKVSEKQNIIFMIIGVIYIKLLPRS